MTLNLDFKVTGLSDVIDVLCAQLTRDLFAIAKFLLLLDNPEVLVFLDQTSYARSQENTTCDFVRVLNETEADKNGEEETQISDAVI